MPALCDFRLSAKGEPHGSESRGSATVNLGNPKEFTIHQLAERVIKLTNLRSNLLFLDLPADDPKQRQPDITLARKKLEWHPTVELDEGLKHTISCFADPELRSALLPASQPTAAVRQDARREYV
jgi:nucleoside-diphosphate-sugar epimerase